MNKISTTLKIKVTKANKNKEQISDFPSGNTLDIIKLFARTYDPKNDKKEIVLN